MRNSAHIAHSAPRFQPPGQERPDPLEDMGWEDQFELLSSRTKARLRERFCESLDNEQVERMAFDGCEGIDQDGECWMAKLWRKFLADAIDGDARLADEARTNMEQR